MCARSRSRGSRMNRAAGTEVAKELFDVDVAMGRVRAAVRPFPRAALFELADDGFASPFEQLVACIISIRTRDETMLPVARRLFSRARTAHEVVSLSVAEIDQLIGPSTFHEAKARQIHNLAHSLVENYGGNLPCD